MPDVVQLALGAYRTNCYLIAAEGAEQAVVVDPGDGAGIVLDELGRRGWRAAGVLVTHGHHDHLGAVHAVAEAFGVDVWMPRREADRLRTLAGAEHEPDHLLDGGEAVSVGGLEFETLPVPGHSPASIAYTTGELLLSGDVLFAGSVGRTDLEGGNAATLLASIRRLMQLPPDTVVLPGHGPATTLRRELETNPFLAELR
ncbi:MAG TPA: MBL fold metallo-hydrolase [Gaiellales bacterium]|nr:MBL fold metallo-hydrolase [Gaiellales bacterium]